jgi:hypothetical protein
VRRHGFTAVAPGTNKQEMSGASGNKTSSRTPSPQRSPRRRSRTRDARRSRTRDAIRPWEVVIERVIR